MSTDADSAFRCEVEPRRHAVVIRAIGELDVAGVGRFTATLSDLVAAGFAHIVLDLRPLAFIDSTGLSAVLRFQRGLPPRTTLELVRGPEHVQRVFELTGVEAMLPFVSVPSTETSHRPLAEAVPLLCVDDDPDELLLLSHWLERDPQFDIVATVTREDAAIAELERSRPRILVSDTMRGPADPGFLARVRAVAPDVKIVVYSGYPGWQLDAVVTRLADATVLKGTDRRELVATLKRLALDV
jgi:anti-anti-sigma factor